MRLLSLKTVALLVVATLFSAGCAPDLPPMPPTSVTDLITVDSHPGEGTQATTGRSVSVHYTGWLYDEAKADHKGQKFDSSHDRGAPLEFTLGAGRVIPGWEQGVLGMRTGGKRTLHIPPTLGYGDRGAGSVIPPNATLIFDVELVNVN